ncbi:phosphatidylinositol/phosphatidylcholine transfer protein SFH4 [Brassica rapa]|uniref:phosphatidylinositol/phosphatidylcholine transfer protein SFH4 n=1 Tax=Brassica campestris TaxID=3711 RepID=UPI00142E11C7|nr:phosphatidylinositol/phosphatidylcholine transfer protein SFH4 [Brassica rapa]XP_048591482.1 phosphatidylinositol/phosphatidylcholine transfer protein SFH4-like [Brassica napus]
MVVKVVDVAWESQEMSNASEGIHQLMFSSARAELCDEPNARESRPLSASCPSTFNERVIISYVLSRQSDLEKQIEALYLTKSEMPYEQEELINAAVYRVDALEA